MIDTKPIVGVLAVALLLAMYAVTLRAQPTPTPVAELRREQGAATRAPAGGDTGALIRRALLEHVRLPSGRYVLHCRRAHGGCEARMRRAAELFVRAGYEHEIDPWLLAAIALRESGGNPDALGARGELGLMQLHPASRAGREAAARCRETPRACVAIQVDCAARLLRASIDRCGDEASALGMYNAGRCEPTDYARAVLARRDRMRGSS